MPALSAENGQAWDAMALVRYPSRQPIEVERLGLWRSIVGLQTYAFYCVIL